MKHLSAMVSVKYLVSTAGVCLLLAIPPLHAVEEQHATGAPPAGQTTTRSVTAKAIVKKINKKDRTITLKGENGKTTTIQVGDEVRNFDQIHKGDEVTFHYEESMALAIHKANEPPSSSEQQMLLRAPPGQKPSGARIRTTQVSATVEHIDRQDREVTLRGPEGETRTLKVGKDVEGFDRLQTGDQVVATYTEIIAIDVTKPM